MSYLPVLFGFGPIGLPEILLILLVVVLIFGAKRLPEIGSGLGKGIRGFRESLKGDESSEKKEIDASGDKREEAEERS